MQDCLIHIISQDSGSDLESLREEESKILCSFFSPHEGHPNELISKAIGDFFYNFKNKHISEAAQQNAPLGWRTKENGIVYFENYKTKKYNSIFIGNECANLAQKIIEATSKVQLIHHAYNLRSFDFYYSITINAYGAHIKATTSGTKIYDGIAANYKCAMELFSDEY